MSCDHVREHYSIILKNQGNVKGNVKPCFEIDVSIVVLSLNKISANVISLK